MRTQRSLGKYVALKVAVASDAAIRSEADALTELCPNPNTLDTPQLPIPKLLDSFALKGPNGFHEVLALEPYAEFQPPIGPPFLQCQNSVSFHIPLLPYLPRYLR